jgi:hypothetical protein
MQEAPQQTDSSLQQWLSRAPKVVRGVATTAFWVGAIIAALYVIGLVLAAISEVFNRTFEYIADALRRYAANDAAIQSFMHNIWEPASPPERFIIVGISVTLFLIVLNWFTSDNKK